VEAAPSATTPARISVVVLIVNSLSVVGRDALPSKRRRYDRGIADLEAVKNEAKSSFPSGHKHR